MAAVFVESLEKLNKEVNEHATMTRCRKLQPRPGLLVLAKLPHDNWYEVFVVSFSKLCYAFHWYICVTEWPVVC